MNTDMNTVRLLGAAQVMVFVSIMIMGGFLASAVGIRQYIRYAPEYFKKPQPVADQPICLHWLKAWQSLPWAFCIMSSFTKSTRSSRLWPWDVFW